MLPSLSILPHPIGVEGNRIVTKTLPPRTIAIPEGFTMIGTPVWKYNNMGSPIATYTTPLTAAAAIDIVFSLVLTGSNHKYVIPNAGYIYLRLDPNLIGYHHRQIVEFLVVDGRGLASLYATQHDVAQRIQEAIPTALTEFQSIFNESVVATTFQVRLERANDTWYFVLPKQSVYEANRSHP